MPFVATRVDLENVTLSEISQKEKDILYDITSMCNPESNANESVCKQKQTHRQREGPGGCRKGAGWEDGEIGEGAERQQPPVAGKRAPSSVLHGAESQQYSSYCARWQMARLMVAVIL